MIPQGSTPIKNDILIEIFAKGKLKYAEMRIILYTIRWSWGFDMGNRRQDWTNPLSIARISNDIEMKYPEAHRAISGLTKKNILVVKDGRYKFNEHTETWSITKSDITKSDITKSDITKSDNSVSQKVIPDITKSYKSITKSYNPPPANADENRAVLTLKETSKETIKETIKEKKNKEKEKTANQLPVKISFNRKIFKFENIPKEKLVKWKEVYAALDVEKEIRKMEVWIAANPNRNKKNLERFITNWLARAEEKGGRSETNRRYFGLTKKFTREEEERLDVMQSARAGEW